MADLDKLQIEISASATEAEKAIDSLCTKLSRLSSTLTHLDGNGIRDFANGVSRLADSMTRIGNFRAGSFTSLAKNLTTLSTVNGANFGGLAKGIEDMSSAFILMQGLDTTGLQNATSAIQSLGNDKAVVATTNLPKIAQGVSEFTTIIQNTPDITAQVNSLKLAINQISRLGSDVGTKGTENLRHVATNLQNFFNILKNINTSGLDTSKFTNTVTAVSKLGYVASGKGIERIRPLADNLKYLFDTLSKAPKVDKTLISMTRALSNLTANLGNVSSRSNSASNGLSTFGNTANTVHKTTLSLASALGTLYANFWVLARAFKTLWTQVDKASNLKEVDNYLENSLKQIASTSMEGYKELGYKSADAYIEATKTELKKSVNEITEQMTGFTIDANGMAQQSGIKNLGINVNDLEQYEAQFAQMSSSMGATANNSMVLSEVLTKLGADLASVKDISYTDAWDKLSSGLVGMARSTDMFGVNLRVANLNQKLMDLGIDTTVAKLSGEQKALLRTIVLLDDTRFAWADLSETIQSPANQIKMLSASFSQLGQVIGQIFLAGIARVIPYINALVIALQHLFQWIIGVFGITLPETTASASGNMDSFTDEIYDTSDALDDASASAKKLKKNVLGIDELNILQEKDGSSTSGINGYNGDDLQKAFDDITNQYKIAWDKAYAEMENKAQELAKKIIDAFKSGDWSSIGKKISDAIKNALSSIKWEGIFAGANGIGSRIASLFNGFNDPATFEELGRTIANGINTVFQFVGGFVSKYDWVKAGLSLGSLVNGFVNTIDVNLIATTINDSIKGALSMALSMMQTINWYQIGQKIGTFLANLDWVGIIKKVAQAILTALSACLATLSGLFNANPIAGTIATVLASAFTVGKLTVVGNSIVKALCSNGILSLFTGVGGKMGATTIAGMNTATLGAETVSTGMGLSIGGWIVAGVTTAIASFSLGEYIYTEWGGDVNNLLSHNVGVISKYVFEDMGDQWNQTIDNSMAHWESGLKSITYDTKDYNGRMLFDPENLVYEKDTIYQIQCILEEIGSNDWEDSFDWGLEEHGGYLAQYNQEARNYVANLRDSYDQLDANARAYLEYSYGIKATAGGVVILNSQIEEARKVQVGYYNALQEQETAELKRQNAMKKTKEIVEESKSSFDKLPSSMQKYIQEYEKATGTTTTYTREIEENVKNQKLHEDAVNATKEAIAQYAEEQRKAHEKNSEIINDFSMLSDNLLTTTDYTKNFEDTAGRISTTIMPELNTQIGTFNTEIGQASTDFAVFDKKLTDFESNLKKELPVVQKAFTDTVTAITKAIEDALSWYDVNIAPRFTLEHWNDVLSCIPTAFDDAFARVQSIIANRMNTIIDAINDSVSDISWDAIVIDGQEVSPSGSTSLFKIKRIEGFATGGYPDKGMFMMNEGDSAEMIGSINGRTAVVNNDQIVQAVSNGVSNAVAEAMTPYLAQIANNTRETADKDLSVNIGDRDIARANIRGQRSLGRTIISTI